MPKPPKHIGERSSKRKYIAIQLSFQQDCEMLLNRYLQYATFSFETFSEIWREVKFGLVFLGKYRQFELAHYTQLLLHCAKKYLILSQCKLTKVGGLYLLYSLYFIQPINFSTVQCVWDQNSKLGNDFEIKFTSLVDNYILCNNIKARFDSFSSFNVLAQELKDLRELQILGFRICYFTFGNLVKIRILLDEFQVIKDLITFLKQDKHLEALYIFKLLLEAEAFDFVASQFPFTIEELHVASDVSLTNNIFPRDGAKVNFDFQKETQLAVKKIKQLDEEFKKKLEAYQSKHSNVPVYDHDSIDIVKELEDILKQCKENAHSTAGSSSNAIVDENAKRNLEEARKIGEKRRKIIGSAFSKDTRSQNLLQRLGDGTTS